MVSDTSMPPSPLQLASLRFHTSLCTRLLQKIPQVLVTAGPDTPSPGPSKGLRHELPQRSRLKPSPSLLLQSQHMREAENRQRRGKHTLYGTDLLKQLGPSKENQLLALIIAYIFISRTRKISTDKYTFHQNAFG